MTPSQASFRRTWILGLIATLLVILIPVVLLARNKPAPTDDPWARLPARSEPTSHASLLTGPFESGPEVTAACLTCHENAAHEVAQTVHFTWESDPLLLPGRDEPVTIGKKNQINNFCLGIEGNWPGCTRCHAGYGWTDDSFDNTDETLVDCLACHANMSFYAKGAGGLPADGVDLLTAAQSVGNPTRQNCGSCHFNGGGGNAVKHGDLDESLYFPGENVDVHMGRHNFTCVDCHQAENHAVRGHAMSVSPLGHSNTFGCADCHSGSFHQDSRINDHLDAVACQTCHIPQGALRDATKMDWDWSSAGQDLPEDPHLYMKIKGTFVYEQRFQPSYAWYNGQSTRYIKGDAIDLTAPVIEINAPVGSIADPNAQIRPFKIHTGTQPYDLNYLHLLVPKTVGEGGYWVDFDWDQAFRLNVPNTGLAYSGAFDFVETEMYWPLSHMVQPTANALQCNDCHGENGRMDWQALGYFGDPLHWGSRARQQGVQENAGR